MAGPHPAVAQVRLAVRRCLSSRGIGCASFEPGDLVLAACSGGADSLALAAALAFEAPRLGLRAGGVTVDHGLQPGSGTQALAAVNAMTQLGLDPVSSVGAQVGQAGAPGYPGPEAAARAARYLALDRAADQAGAVAILLGHTSDDQAETVLLGLARGSGTRSLAGMPERAGRCLRPLLGLSRAQTRAACAAQGLQPWDDPQNSDPAFARARVRHRLMPALEAELGPGVARALARTAQLLRADADYLDSLAQAEAERMASAEPGLPLDALMALPEAIRSRVLRDAAVAAGCPAGGLTARHVAALDALVTDWRGQRWTELPGGVRGVRRRGRLLLSGRAAAQPTRALRQAPSGRAAAQPTRALRQAPSGELRQAPAGVQPPDQRGQSGGRDNGADGGQPDHAGAAGRRDQAGRRPVDAADIGADLQGVLITSEQLQQRIAELAAQIDKDYADRELLLVGVLKGAVMVMADLARAIRLPVTMDWMAVSSYGSGTKSSGVVRILKDLDTDITGRHVLVVEDIIDSGLTLSWLMRNLQSRGPASLRICALLRKPGAARADVDVAYTGFDIGDAFVVGYGLDYAERYRNLQFIGTLAPHVYRGEAAGTGSHPGTGPAATPAAAG